jgi:adenylosuccinate synthase
VAYIGDHNTQDDWQGAFRFGHLDPVLLKYAAVVSGGVDQVFLTHCDKVNGPTLCAEYQMRGCMTGADLAEVNVSYRQVEDVTSVVESAIGAEVRYTSNGPAFTDKKVVSNKD